MNSYLNLDTSKYIFRWVDPALNIVNEKEFDSIEELNSFKEYITHSNPILDFFLMEKDEGEELYEFEIIKKFKSSLELGFKHAIVPSHPLYNDPKELIEFCYHHYNRDNLDILYDTNYQIESLMLNYCFNNLYANPVETSHELLSILKNVDDPNIKLKTFYKYFMVIYNDPLSFEHSVNIQLLFNDFLGLKHEYESSGEPLPKKLEMFCSLI